MALWEYNPSQETLGVEKFVFVGRANISFSDLNAAILWHIIRRYRVRSEAWIQSRDLGQETGKFQQQCENVYCYNHCLDSRNWHRHSIAVSVNEFVAIVK